MSESSFDASSAGGSSGPGNHLPAKDALKTAEEEEAEDAALDTPSQGLTYGIFGVVYTVSRERTVTWSFVAAKLFLDAWQLFMLVFSPKLGYIMDPTSTWWRIVSVISLNDFMSARGFSFFLACLYTFVALLALTVGLCVWVAWSFKNKRFDHVWPITYLRAFGIVFFQLLDVASMTFFLITLDCQYYDAPAEVLYHNQEFPEQYCWSMPYIIHVAVAAISLLLYVLLAALFQMGEMELNMKTRNPLGMGHSSVEVQALLLKFVMACAATFLDNQWMAGVITGCMLVLLYLSIRWVPYYHEWMNHVRSSVYGAVLYSAAVTMLLVFMPGVDPDDDDAVYAWRRACTIACVVGLLPAGALAALGSHLRLRFALHRVARKFRDAPAGTKLHYIYNFSHPLSVEIAARCCRVWVEKDVLDETAVVTCGAVIKAGLHHLPNSPYLSILFASYLLDVQGSYQSGLLELRAAKKLDASFLERFAIFSREQQHLQRVSAKGGNGHDLVSYVEQQRDMRLALRVHKEALLATSMFWKTLVSPIVRLEKLAAAVAAFDEAVKQADKGYRVVLQRNSDNWKLQRLYAVFLENVRCDPWAAAKWRAEADRLFQAEEEDKHNSLMDVTALDDPNCPLSACSKILKAAMADVNRGVIIMNANCLMTAANKATCEALGYSRKQLIGKNLNILLPQPFAKMHDSFVANYIRTGVSSRILNNTSRLVLLHSEHYIVPVSIHIAKLSGSGMDSLFMGIFEVLPTPPDTACVWVMGNGAIMSADNTFSDWFAYPVREIANRYLHSLVADPKALIKAFKLARKQEMLHEQEELQAQVQHSGLEDSMHVLRTSVGVHREAEEGLTLPVMIKHKYAGVLSCDVNITNGGGEGSRHFFSVLIRRPPALKSMIVTNRKTGRLLHVSADVADALGYPVSRLLGDMAMTAWDALLPEPFCQLHKAHFAPETPSQSNAAPPSALSCRSGLSMCLSALTVSGLELRPFRLKMETLRLEGSEGYCVAQVEPRAMSQALDERRLVVVLDEEGRVTSVSDSPHDLFGFDPESMLGRSIAEFVNVFNPPEEDGLTAELLEEEDKSSDYLHETLLELAIRSLSTTSNSYRVGVTTPPEIQINHMATAHRRGALAHAIAAHIARECMHSAVMQVKVHLGSLNKLGSTLRRERRASHITHLRTLASAQPGEIPYPQMTQPSLSMEVEELDKELASPAAAKLPSTRPSGLFTVRRSTVRSASVVRKGGLRLELHLWKVDALVGVLQIDRTGRISGASPIPLHPPGVLLGDDKLTGLDIGLVLPAMRQRPLSALFLPDFGTNPASMAPKARGGLKERKNKGPVRERRPGPVNVVTTTHLTDGRPLQLTAQAVWGWGFSKEIHIILTAHQPTNGIPFFRDWLRANPVPTRQGTVGSALYSPVKLPTAAAAARPVFLSRAPSASAPALSPTADSPEPATLPGAAEEVELDAPLAARPSDSPTGRSEDLGPKVVDASDFNLKEGDALEKAIAELRLDAAQAASPFNAVKSVGFSNREHLGGDDGALPGQVRTSTERTEDWVKRAGSDWRGGGAHPQARRKHDPALATSLTQDHFERASEYTEAGSETGREAEEQDAAKELVFLKDDSAMCDTKLDEDAYHTLGDLPMMARPEAKAEDGNVGESASGHRPSDDGSGHDGSSTEGDSGGQADYRRGRRFKRLTRMLTGVGARRSLRNFKMQAWGAAAFVMLVTVVCFIVMFLMLRQQQQGVAVLNDVGRAGVEVGQIHMALAACDLLIRGRYVPGLPGLSSASDLNATCLAPMTQHAGSLLDLMYSSYYTVMARPDVYGLHDLWNSPTVNCTAYEDGKRPGDVLAITAKRSLWDMGNMFGVSALQLSQNLVEHNRTTTTNWRNWSYPLYLGNNSEAIFEGLYETLDGLVQVVIQLAEDVNQVQYNLVAVEGCVCSVLVIVWMFIITTKMTLTRWWLYNTFMVIPVSLLKALAKKTATFEDLVLLDMEADNAPQQDAAAMDAAAGSGGEHSLVKFNTGGSAAVSTRIASVAGMLRHMVSRLVLWRKRSSVSPVYTKRRLVRSHTTAAWLCAPFLAWGIMIIAINVSGHNILKSVAGPIAIFNLVNFVTVEYYRAISLAEDMMQNSDAGDTALLRDRLVSSYNLPTDYRAMLYGGSAVPNQTSSHYTLATTGVAFSGDAAAELLYHTTSCLRIDQSTCLQPDDPLYPVTVKGLDALMQRFMTSMHAVLSLSMSDILQQRETIPQFSFFWNTEDDVDGGLTRLKEDFFSHVTEVYQQVIVLHVIALVLSTALMVVFVFFMLKPYLRQLTNEARRIAELLSQLPTDVDVESLVRRAQINSAIEVAKDEPTNSMSRNSSSFMQSGKS